MKHRLTEVEVTSILYKLFYIVDGVKYGSRDYWVRKEEMIDDAIYFTHFTYDFKKNKVVMYVPFMYDNYKIITYYQCPSSS